MKVNLGAPLRQRKLARVKISLGIKAAVVEAVVLVLVVDSVLFGAHRTLYVLPFFPIPG